MTLKTSQNNHKFKNRVFKKNDKCLLHLKFGFFGFFLKNNLNFEFVYITFFKKFFKIIKLKNSKIWFFLAKNYPISYKSKNSRMGKGKGDFLRWVFHLYSNFLFLEIKNFHLFKIFLMLYKVNFKMPRKIYCFFNHNFLLFDLFFKTNYSYFFKKKYVL